MSDLGTGDAQSADDELEGPLELRAVVAAREELLVLDDRAVHGDGRSPFVLAENLGDALDEVLGRIVVDTKYRQSFHAMKRAVPLCRIRRSEDLLALGLTGSLRLEDDRGPRTTLVRHVVHLGAELEGERLVPVVLDNVHPVSASGDLRSTSRCV